MLKETGEALPCPAIINRWLPEGALNAREKGTKTGGDPNLAGYPQSPVGKREEVRKGEKRRRN